VTGPARAELRFRDQGMQSFIGTLEKVRERAVYMSREQDLEDSLRAYHCCCVSRDPYPVAGYSHSSVTGSFLKSDAVLLTVLSAIYSSGGAGSSTNVAGGGDATAPPPLPPAPGPDELPPGYDA